MSDSKQLRYPDLLDEALARIPALAPEWTDHNPADPGIALLELAAWLTETVLYRSTRIDDRSRRALLGLIEGADPRADLSGEALEAAIRGAIRGLRRPYRAVTPRDYIDRIKHDWPLSAAAKAIGLERHVAHAVVLPRCDLEADDRFARRDAHISVVVVPQRLCWSFEGTLSTARPKLFVMENVPGKLWATFPAGGPVQVTAAHTGAVLYEGDFAANERGELETSATQLAQTGEFVIEMDQANAVAGMNSGTPSGGNRRLTGGDGTLLGCRYVPMRRACDVMVTVTSTTDTPLLLRARNFSAGMVAEATGEGVVSLWFAGPKRDGSVNAIRRDWQLQLSAPDAEPGAEVDVCWHVQRVEYPWAWNQHRGDQLLDGIWSFLDERRALGTRHHVVGPRWVDVMIDAEIYLTDGTDPDLVRPRLIDTLVQHFAAPGHDEDTRAIGADLHYTEVIALIESVAGVDYVDKLSLTPEDRRLTDDDEHYGVRLDPDELAVLRIDQCNLAFFERS